MQVRFLGGEGPLEEGMATHSSILAWSIPWTKEPGSAEQGAFPRRPASCVWLQVSQGWHPAGAKHRARRP